MEGLAAVSAGVTNTYGNGDGQNVKHYYAGADVGKKLKRKKERNNGKWIIKKRCKRL